MRHFRRRPVTIHFLLPLLLLLLPLLPAAAPAQQASGSVPEELVRAMVGNDATLLIEELPGEISDLIALPDGVRVIGSVVQESHSTAYLSTSQHPDALVASFSEPLLADGWRVPEEREPPRGFQRPAAQGASTTFCGPSGQLLSISARPGDDTTLYMRFHPQFPGVLPCDRPTGPPRGRTNDLEERMPVLDTPEDEFQRSTGHGGGLDQRWSGVELRSDRSPAQIADDYAAQVEAQGWEPAFSADGTETAVRTWTRTFEDGFEARGALMVSALGGGTHEALFRLIRLSR